MKKIIFFFTAVLFFLTPVKASAATDFQQQIDNIAENYDIPAEKVMDITPEDIIDYVCESVKNSAVKPLQLSARIIAILLLFSVIKAVGTDNNSTAINVIDSVCTVVVFVNLIEPVGTVIGVAAEKLSEVKNFMTVFLPVFAGISMSSGEFFTSTVYSGFFLTALVFIADFLLTTVIPSLHRYFSLIIADTLSPFVKLKSISDFYVKSVRWLMKTIVSIICFVLTLQTVISQGKDTITVKAGRFITGAAIPVIGSALQDAVGSVFAGMEAIKGFAGAVGIAGIAMIFIPSLLSLAVYWICTSFMYITADMFDIKNISSCLKGFVTVIELTVSIVFLYMTMLVFSLTIMISLTNGV